MFPSTSYLAALFALSLIAVLQFAGGQAAASESSWADLSADQIEALQSIEQNRSIHVFDIVNRLGPEADARGLVGWRDELTAALSSAAAGRLQTALSASNYAGVLAALLGSAATPQAVDGQLFHHASIDSDTAQSAGSEAELAFTPLTPCRIVDTRLAGGAISGGSSRAFDARGQDLDYQGGGECADLAEDAPAIAINVTVANPAGRGFLTLYPEGETRPLASTINYAAETLTLANSTIIKTASLTGLDFRVYALTSTDVVIDLLGVFGPIDSGGSAGSGSAGSGSAGSGSAGSGSGRKRLGRKRPCRKRPCRD